MLLKCVHCGKKFEPSVQTAYKYRKGHRKVVCSLTCRGQLNFEVLRKKYGFKKQTTQRRAQAKLCLAVRKGLLKRPTICQKCKKNPNDKVGIHAHHYVGYDQPLAVQWLCTRCHKKEDAHTVPRGSANCFAKLTEKEVVSIKARMKTQSLVSLAAEYGVARQTIWKIKHGQAWRHVL